MITTAVIAFREFLEAFLIVGVFFGISRTLKLKKELEISLAAGIGILLSLLLSTLIYIFSDQARVVLTEETAELLENYLLIFSGLFIAYVVFSLHHTIRKGRTEALLTAHKKMQQKAFDISLFFTIVFLVLREGFEIALFTASASLFSEFMQNFTGLIIGFGLSSVIGLMTYFAYVKLPISKIFKWTEYMIILLGAALVQVGVTELFEVQFHIELEEMFRIPLNFLPDKHSVIGHIIQSFTGFDRDFSLPRLAIMVTYIGIIYFIFIKRRPAKIVNL